MYGTLKSADASDDNSLNSQQANANKQIDVTNQNLLTTTTTTTTATDGNNSTQATRPNKRKKRIYSHCHIQSDPHQNHASANTIDKSARRRLIAASIVCLVFMIAEVVGGVLSNSLAIATDAAHLLTDFASFMISLFALWLSSRPATRKMSFGWYRAEVIGALLSVLMIWLVTGLLVYMAVERLRTGEFEIDSLVMVITATAGLLVNIIMAIALNVDGHGHGHFHSHAGHSHNHGHAHNHDISHHSHLVHIHDNSDGGDDDEEDDDNDNDNDDEQHEGNTKGELMTQSLKTRQAIEKHADAMQQDNLSKSVHLLSSEHSTSNGSGGGKGEKRTTKRKKCNRQATIDPNNSNGRGRSNINVRAAFIHVIGDFLQSLGVLIAALVIHFEPSYAIVDPICTFLFSIIVLVTTINIIKDATNVLMEGIPDGINFIEVREKLQSLSYVIRVHNLRIWSLSLDKVAISTHLVIDTSKTTSSQALKQAIEALKSGYNFFEVTIQIEEYRDDMRDCEQCQDEDEQVAINMIESPPIRRDSSMANGSSGGGGGGGGGSGPSV